MSIKKNDNKQTQKKKQAQQAMSAMVDTMSGSGKIILQEPKGLKLTNTTQTTPQ